MTAGFAARPRSATRKVPQNNARNSSRRAASRRCAAEFEGAAYPWGPPTDYGREKAWEAAKALPVDQAEIALAIWRFRRVTSEDNGKEVLGALGRDFLMLSDAQRALLTRRYPTASRMFGGQMLPHPS